MTSRCGTGVSDDVNVRSALYYIEALSLSDPPAINGPWSDVIGEGTFYGLD